MRKYVFFVLSAFTLDCSSASFDCDKAKEKVEILICSHAEVSAADEYFSGFFLSIQKTLDSEEKERLKKSQLDWLKNTRNEFETSECAINTYRRRENEILDWYKNKKPTPLETDKLQEPLTGQQETWKSLEPKFRKTE